MKKISLILALVALVMASCKTAGNADKKTDNASHEAYKIVKFENNPYMAEVRWGEDYDQAVTLEKVQTYLKKRAEEAEKAAAGGCTSFRKDQLHGRNIDWTMQPFVSLIIHMPKTDKVKYSSVSVIAGSPSMTKEVIDKNEFVPEDLRTTLPASVVDGINEKGVVINHNIVPYDKDRKPAYTQDGDIPSLMVCRYVLDNCGTAKEAIDSLQAKKVSQSVVKVAGDYSHFMISDPTETYVVEWVNDQFVYTKFENKDGKGEFISEKGNPAIMTNFFVALGEKYGVGTPEFYKNHPYADGVERFDTVKAQLPKAKTVDDFMNICKSVWYKKFCEGKTNWLTENAGVLYSYDDATGKAFWCEGRDKDGKPINQHMMDNDDVYAAAKAAFASDFQKNYYKEFLANWNEPKAGNTYWFTQHSVVYDIKNLKAYIIVQEGHDNPEMYEFGI